VIKTFFLALLTCAAIGGSRAHAAGSWVIAPVTSGVSVVIMPVTQLVATMGMEHRAAARNWGALR